MALRQGSRPAPDLRLLIAVFLGSYAVLSLLSYTRHRRAREHRTTVTLALNGRQAAFPALEDSGNCLTDPISGDGVMLASPAALEPLFPGRAALLSLPAVELLERAAEDEELRGRFRLLRAGSVAGRTLLAAFRPDGATVDGKERALLVAVNEAAEGDGFQGIV